ncbi:hypothetical protein KPATCC21470_0430 [Kitasatospora purpeofusca]
MANVTGPRFPWRTAMITCRGELASPARLVGVAARLAVQVFLVVCLWRGLYVGTATVAGVDRDRAVTYAVLAVLAARIREVDRFAARDEVIQHVTSGTIVYWFLRPMAARRYYALRAFGDRLYGFVWVFTGYLVVSALGLVVPPPSAASAVACAVSLVCGQLTFHYIVLLTDLMCFWALRNESAILVLGFAQNLLAGVYVPLWLFPHWFTAVAGVLPFQATLNAPLALYIGRTPPQEALSVVAGQLAWALVLAVLTRLLWARAAGRIVVQGG